MKHSLSAKLMVTGQLKIVQRLICFFLQAEDDIRDHCVTGVQTCALPISCSVDRSIGRGGGVDPAGIGDHLRATVRDEGQCPREVRGKIAGVAARFVTLTILLEDRERQLRERFQAEIVDTFAEQRVDRRRRVAVEALPAGDDDFTHGRAHAWTRGRRSTQGLACSSCAATRIRMSSRPYAAISWTPMGRLSPFQCNGSEIAGSPGMVARGGNGPNVAARSKPGNGPAGG